MLELARRLVWFFVLASATSYSVFLVAGNAIHKQGLTDSRSVVVRDSLRVGEHHLSGMVMVSSTCKQLSVETEEITSSLYHLRFTTWDEPYVHCVNEDTPRTFRAIVFAPSTGVDFISTLDETPLQITVTPTISYTR